MTLPLSRLPEPAPERARAAPARRRSTRDAAALLTVGAVVMLAPLWVPIVLAAWFAHLTRGAHRALARRLGGRNWAAGVLTLLLAAALLTPVVVLAVSLASDANDLARRLAGSASPADFVKGIVTREAPAGGGPAAGGFDARRLLEFAREHGQRGLTTLRSLTGTLAGGAINLFVFFFGAYAFLVDGPRFYEWLLDHSPLARPHAHRLANAFHETGRGLVVGVGLTALVQGAIATIAYVVLGVPQAILLGLTTCFTALIPALGTSIVWVPVAAGLALTGRTGAALAMCGVGVGVIAIVDNILRPVLARYGRLDLPVFVLVAAMFGGFFVAGAWGLILGPLLVRLGKEALVIAREEGVVGTEKVAARLAPAGGRGGARAPSRRGPPARPRARGPAARPA